jgi:uncharacterized protein YoxC
MANDSIKEAGEKLPDVVEMVADTMASFRQEMEHNDELGIRIAAKTRFILRAVFTTLIMSAIYLVFMIYQMSSNMTAMTTHLEDMYRSFGTMSQDMHEITKTVGSMSKSISGMPVIAGSIQKMDGDVRAMKGSVHEINQSIKAIDNDMVKINSDMLVMTGRLSNMRHSVNMMSYDVNEMAAPVNTGPMSGFWPR